MADTALDVPSTASSTPTALTDLENVALESTTTAVQWAEDPFDSGSGDIILRSCDNVHFGLYKGVLANASSIFKDLFANAQPPAEAELKTEGEEMDGLPVISMEESSTVLNQLLRLYHEPFTLHISVDNTLVPTLCGTILAARKYFMTYADNEAKKLLNKFCLASSRFAVQAYAVACKNGMTSEIQTAAKASLLHAPNYEENAVLDHISGSDAFRLIRYRQKCVDAVKTVTSRSAQPEGFHQWNFQDWCSGSRPFFYGGHNPDVPSSDHLRCKEHVTWIPGEFQVYLEEVTAALLARPHPQVICDDKHHDKLRHVAYYTDKYTPGEWKKDIKALEREFFEGVNAAISKVRTFASRMSLYGFCWGAWAVLTRS